MKPSDPGSDGGEASAATAAPSGSSPRPTYDGPTAIPYAGVTRFLWGDDDSGRVADWIYASTDKIHMLVYGLPPDGRCLHSEAHRTIFGADVTYHVLEGTLVLANPESGEVRVAREGETILFRRDTWHHIFSHDTRRLRVLEFFAPPPSTGTSRAYAQQRPYLTESRHADDSLLGRWPPVLPPASLQLRRCDDRIWRLDGDALVGIIASTEHLTVGSLSLMPGRRSAVETHGVTSASTSPTACCTYARSAATRPAGTSLHRATASIARTGSVTSTSTSEMLRPRPSSASRPTGDRDGVSRHRRRRDEGRGGNRGRWLGRRSAQNVGAIGSRPRRHAAACRLRRPGAARGRPRSSRGRRDRRLRAGRPPRRRARRGLVRLARARHRRVVQGHRADPRRIGRASRGAGRGRVRRR